MWFKSCRAVPWMVCVSIKPSCLTRIPSSVHGPTTSTSLVPPPPSNTITLSGSVAFSRRAFSVATLILLPSLMIVRPLLQLAAPGLVCGCGICGN